jgi:hypothetical protein
LLDGASPIRVEEVNCRIRPIEPTASRKIRTWDARKRDSVRLTQPDSNMMLTPLGAPQVLEVLQPVLDRKS